MAIVKKIRNFNHKYLKKVGYIPYFKILQCILLLLIVIKLYRFDSIIKSYFEIKSIEIKEIECPIE